MIFWIGFTLMVLNEGFVMMRHVSPFFDKLRKKVIKKLGESMVSSSWHSRLHLDSSRNTRINSKLLQINALAFCDCILGVILLYILLTKKT